jgi:hypothetical protein
LSLRSGPRPFQVCPLCCARGAHLRKSRVPWDLEKFWLGHANRSVTDKYSKQLKKNVQWRKEVAENTGFFLEISAGARG